MAIMFGFSSSVQLNDPDWYFWFPLYACACIVNLLNWRISPKGSIKHIAEVVLCLGVFLFIKVVVEDFVTKKEEGSWESCCIWNGELSGFQLRASFCVLCDSERGNENFDALNEAKAQSELLKLYTMDSKLQRMSQG
ncbi:hypothetical protein V6N12_041537 [Hibiscus sabdariffa]|uniref:Uncharacterized protein n=1 Tax=Hibiscus sabdariffa TaxID=183260 RepID=A0ABR1ZEP6_9ROSI